jgi:CubicO group peptidase (beta-lactamase class C family)
VTTNASVVDWDDVVDDALRRGRGPDGRPVDQLLADTSVPGVALSVVIDGEIVASLAYGTTPDGVAMSTDTVLQVGSVSKPVAAIGAMALVAAGTLPWDTDVASLSTTFTIPVGAQSGQRPVTVERLLSHTAGTNVDGFVGYGPGEELPSLLDVLEGRGNSDAVLVETAPGTAFSYSGGGYALLEQLMLDASGETSFDALMRSLVFDPAGLTDTSFLPGPPAGEPVSGGSVDGVALDAGWQIHPEHAAAGLWTTANDLARLMAVFMDDLDGAGVVLPERWARSMIVAADGAGDTAIGHGWFLDRRESPRVFRHGGRNIGYISSITGSTEQRTAIVVVTNGFPGGSDVTRAITRTVAEAIGWDEVADVSDG